LAELYIENPAEIYDEIKKEEYINIFR